MLKRIALSAALIGSLLIAPGTADAATKKAKATAHSKIRVHVVGAKGHGVGHARVTIAGQGKSKFKVSHAAGSRGFFTTGNVASGSYKISARRRGHGSGKAAVEVKTAGTQKVTVKLGGSARSTATVIHARTTHLLGVSTKAKKKATATTVSPATKMPVKPSAKASSVK